MPKSLCVLRVWFFAFGTADFCYVQNSSEVDQVNDLIKKLISTAYIDRQELDFISNEEFNDHSIDKIIKYTIHE